MLNVMGHNGNGERASDEENMEKVIVKWKGRPGLVMEQVVEKRKGHSYAANGGEGMELVTEKWKDIVMKD